MPRNGSGVMSKPPGTTFAAGTTIESAKVNSVVDDIITDLNTARPIVAGGTGATSASAARTALEVPGLTTNNIMSGVNTHTKIVKWAKGADVASATALTLGDDGNYFDVTGTTAITSIATKGVGTVVKLHFDAGLTLTHNATDLVLPGGVNIPTAAGDEAEFIEYATGDWRCTNYVKASGLALAQFGAWEVIGAPIRTASGVSSVDITDLGAFRKLRITGKLSVATDAVNVQVRTSTDNGSSFAASSGDYVSQGINSAATVTTSVSTSGATGTGVPLAAINPIGNAANEAAKFTIEIEDFNATQYSYFSVSTDYLDQNGVLNKVSISGIRSNSTARNALRFIASSGNIANISYTVEGIRG